MRTETITALELPASLAGAAQAPAEFNSPEAIAARLAMIREKQIARMEQIIADESEHLSNSITWRDAFCHEDDASECMLGTARDLAVKIYDLGWVAPSIRHPHLNCPACQSV